MGALEWELLGGMMDVLSVVEARPWLGSYCSQLSVHFLRSGGKGSSSISRLTGRLLPVACCLRPKSNGQRATGNAK